MTDYREAIIKFNREHSLLNKDCLFVTKLRALSLTDAQIVGVLNAVESTCRECFNNDLMCYCSRDC